MFDLEGFIVSGEQLMGLLMLGLGPIRISLAWMNIAKDLSHKEQRQVAWRIVWVGMVMVIGIMALGFFIRNWLPAKEWLGIGIGIVLIVSTLFSRTSQVVPTPGVGGDRNLLELAIYPLAIPTMINPAGLGLLLMVAGFVRDPVPYLGFFGIVAGIFLINFIVMIVIGRIHRPISAALIQVVGQIFAILLTALGSSIIIKSLAILEVINLNIP